MQAFLFICSIKVAIILNAPDQKIKIAVSSCLMGHNVRYDGKNMKNDGICDICARFNCIAVCPEAEIGLGTPRPPLVIIKEEHSFHARGWTNPCFDVTDSLQRHAQQIISRYPDICGYIFKSRSPSCGVNSTPWQTFVNKETGLTDGIYSAKIKQLIPALPITEETQLCDASKIDDFVQQVFHYASGLRPR